jgi:hypothetical protein
MANKRTQKIEGAEKAAFDSINKDDVFRLENRRKAY